MGKIRYRYIIVVLCVVCFCRLTLKTYYTFVYGTESGVAGGGVPSRTNQKKILMHSENRPATKRDKCEKKILFWTKRKHTKFNRSRHVLCLKSSCNATIVIGMEWTDFLDSHAVIFDHKVVKNWKQLIRYVNCIYRLGKKDHLLRLAKHSLINLERIAVSGL